MIIIRRRLEEHLFNLDETIRVSARNEALLPGIDIVVFHSETEVPHATILKRNRSNVILGRFVIFKKEAPTKGWQVIEVKEPIDSAYKKAIAKWAGMRCKEFPKATNWEWARIKWNEANPNYPIRDM